MTHENFNTFPPFKRNCKTPCLLFATWTQCPHCHAAAPHMRKVQKELRGIMPVYNIDADNHSAVCKQLQIRGFPTIMFLGADRVVRKYKGSHDANKVLEFARMHYG